MDLSEPGELDRRSWRWFQTRLFGLTIESRTWQRLTALAVPDDEVSVEDADREFGVDRE